MNDFGTVREAIEEGGYAFAMAALDRIEAEFKGHKVCEANMDAEIERLRAENEVLVKQFDAAVQSYQAKVEDWRKEAELQANLLEKTEAEVERLKNDRDEYMAELTKRLTAAEDEAEKLRAAGYEHTVHCDDADDLRDALAKEE